MNQVKIQVMPPANWQDFQAIVRDVADFRFKRGTAHEYGRSGQEQHGVDVYAETLEGGHIAIQCKQTNKPLKFKTIETEIIAVQKYPVAIEEFILATTALSDKEVQNSVIKLNESKLHPFRVSIWFWDDINDMINRSGRIMDSFYKHFVAQMQPNDEYKHLAMLRVAFDRPAFKDDFAIERSYEDFMDAIVKTKKFLKTGLLDDRDSGRTIIECVPSDYLPLGDYRNFVMDLDFKIESLYQSAARFGLNNHGIVTVQPHVARRLNMDRKKIIKSLNVQLTAFGLETILVRY